MAHLSIRLLGRVQVDLDGEPVIGFDSDKVRALLAYLVVEDDRPHRREKLAGLLWPEYPESSARTSLRSALANLRQVIGDQEAKPAYLLVTRQAIQFNRFSDSRLDVEVFTSLLTGDPDCPADIVQLEKAHSLYQGDFMEGFSLPDSASFEEWALVTRESLHGQALRALHQMTGYYQEGGAYEQALQLAKRTLELDPYQETAHQQVMWLLAYSSRRNAALAHYRAYCQLLETDLGVVPQEQTQILYKQLHEGELPGPPATTVVLRRVSRQVGECPYRGLAAFREEDASFFFGRELFITRLADTLRTRSLVAIIVGSSGSGKSSTIFAGLLPRLRSQGDWLILHCRPRGYPFQTLAGAFVPLLQPDLDGTDQLKEIFRLAEALRERDLPLHHLAIHALEMRPEFRQLLLVVDQFEELYTLCPEQEERRRFLDELLAAVESGVEQGPFPFVLLLTLRADFISQALSYRPLADALQEGSLILGPMTREELRAVIEKPAEKQGAAFETGLVARIISDVGEEPGNLPLLEFTLTLLWERLDQGWLTHTAYEEIGRVDGALTRYAEKVYTDLSEEDQERVHKIFVQLVQPGKGTEDTRRTANRTELGEQNWSLVRRLTDQRLLVTGQDETGNETVEVVHEALISRWGRLQKWMAEDRAFRTWQESLRMALRGWEASEEDEGALLRGAPLVNAQVWLAERESELSPREQAFIHASVALQENEQARREQRRQRTIVGLTIGLVIALILAGLAVGQWQRADEAEQLAISRRITAQVAITHANFERSVAQTAQARESFQRASAQTAQAQEAQQRATAQANAEARSAAQARAEQQSRQATARLLAAAAIANLEVDPERSILLALQAVDETYAVDKITLQEAEEALHRSVQTSRLYQTIKSEDKEFWFVYFSPDSAHLITWSVTTYPGNTRILDAETGGEQLSIPGVIPLAVHPLRNQWVGVEYDFENNVQRYSIFDISSGQYVFTTSLPLPPVEATMEAYDWNTECLVRALQNGETEVWDLSTVQEILHLGWEGRPFDFRVAFSPDGERLASGNMQGNITIWDLQTGEELLSFQGHSGRVLRIAFSPDGDNLATSSGDGTAKIWKADTGQKLVTLSGHTNEIHSLAFSRNGSYLATGSWDRTVKVWDLMASINTGSGQELLSLAGHTSLIFGIDFSPDGKSLASASFDGSVRIWDVSPEGRGEGGVIVNGKATGPEWTPAIALSPDGTRLATTNADITPKVLEASSGNSLRTLSGHLDRVQRIEFSSDGAYIVTTGEDNLIKGWDATSGEELFSLGGFSCITTGISCDIAYSPDGNHLAIVDNDGALKVFEVSSLLDLRLGSSALELLNIRAHDDWIFDVTYSPNGIQIVTTSQDGTAKVWDAVTGEHLNTLSGHEGWVYRVAYSPDGERIITTSSDGTARVWHAMSGEWLFTLTGHSASVLQADFSPDGALIATTSGDKTVKLWDAETGQEKLTLYGHSAGVSDVVFSPDGKRLYTASQDGTVRVYLLDIAELMDLAQGRLTRDFTSEECQQYLHVNECPTRP